MTEPRAEILVAIPANNEAGHLATCLTSVARAVTRARRAGLVRGSRLVIGAHRCTDATVEVAIRCVAEMDGIDGIVLSIPDELTVGELRTKLVRIAVTAPPALGGADTWLFSTDADSVVPSDWISQMLRVAGKTGAELVAGMVDLVGWPANCEVRAAYRRIIRAGLLPDGGHRHVYAANLALRLSVFEAVGGFPALPHGEEQGLVDAVRTAGYVVATPRQPRVKTSGRMPGRAAEGLGAMLTRLNADPSAFAG